MDHVVFVDAKSKELEKILAASKTTIIRGAAGRKLPHGRVSAGDVLYFIQNNAEGLIRARAVVSSAFHSEKLTSEESEKLVADHQATLQLDPAQFKRWAGKRFLVLVDICQVEVVSPFMIDRSDYGNMDDWLPVENIERIRVQ
jgi:hypothetical protein